MKRIRAGWVLVTLGVLVAGCGESPSGVLQGPTKSVRQVKPEAAVGTGGYRLVKMPESARRSSVMADPASAGAFAYYETLRPR